MRKRLLTSLGIKNFRTFHDFTVGSLRQVNLIVGKNNAGKSSLLEAVRLYSERGAPHVIADILESRDEIAGKYPSNGERFEDVYLAFWNLFHGRNRNPDEVPPIEIGPLGAQDHTLRMMLQWFTEKRSEEGGWFMAPAQLSLFEAEQDEPRLGLAVEFAGKLVYRVLADRGGRWLRRAYYPIPVSTLPCTFVPADGLKPGQLGQWWDNVALTKLEDDIIKALRIIVPETERLNFVAALPRSTRRIAMVKLKNVDQPVPVRSLGDGMNRILSLVLALANAKGGFLLVDEIENGVHYSVQKDLWRLVLSVASRLNVQVFATTHSWDCVRGFQAACQEAPDENGLLIRLEHKREDVRAVLYSEKELQIATRDEIEVR